MHELALEATYRGLLDISVGRVPVDNPDEVPVALNYQATHSPPIPRSVSPSSAWSTTQSQGRLTQRDPLISPYVNAHIEHEVAEYRNVEVPQISTSTFLKDAEELS